MKGLILLIGGCVTKRLLARIALTYTRYFGRVTAAEIKIRPNHSKERMKAFQKGCRLLLFATLLVVPCAGFASCTTAPSGLVGWWRAEANANDSAGTNN